MLEVKSKATSKSKAALLDLVFVALFAAVMTVCAQIQIPFGEVPFTLQTLGVFIAASLLGWKRGTLSVIVYVLLGLAGVPVFAGFSGGIAGASATGKLANIPIAILPIPAIKQVVTNTTFGSICAAPRICGFTKTMYTMVKKVVIPAINSVRTVVPC